MPGDFVNIWVVDHLRSIPNSPDRRFAMDLTWRKSVINREFRIKKEMVISQLRSNPRHLSSCNVLTVYHRSSCILLQKLR